MPKIHLLDKQVSELIAAGEVVERPASVVKELVENAIDAGATAVTVEIQHGGVSFLRVTDNGCGIAREDVPVAFLRHATSKVQTQEDLTRIHTLGFRGEALASIAAVARVELLTRTQDELAGTHYVIAGSEELACEDAGCAPGTTLILRDLFYNTPARMKFLKKDVTEGNAVAAVLDHAALSHPEVSFRFLREGKEALLTPGDGKLKNAVFAVYGRSFTQGLLPVAYELGGVKVWGFVSKPVSARPNRSMQNFFLNGRWVRSRTAMVAMEEAFKGSIMVGRFPACALHLQVDPVVLDVNVHPAKTEVRFMNEKPVFDAVYHAVKTALQQSDAPSTLHLGAQRPAVQPGSPVFRQSPAPQQLPLQPQPPAQHGPAVVCDAVATPPAAPAVQRPLVVHHLPDTALPTPTPCVQPPATQAQAPAREPQGAPVQDTAPVQTQPAPYAAREASPVEARLVGEAFATYMILEQGDELRFIDKHAAHERLLYEKLKAQQGDVPRQMLLAPVPVTLSKEEYSAVLDHLDALSAAGFEAEDFGAGTILLRAVPILLDAQGEDLACAVEEMAGYLAENRTHIATEKQDWLLHNIACRAAVKAGDDSSPAELAALARRLEQEDIRYCPHGRPVSIVLSRRDLERQFGRV